MPGCCTYHAQTVAPGNSSPAWPATMLAAGPGHHARGMAAPQHPEPQAAQFLAFEHVRRDQQMTPAARSKPHDGPPSAGALRAPFRCQRRAFRRHDASAAVAAEFDPPRCTPTAEQRAVGSGCDPERHREDGKRPTRETRQEKPKTECHAAMCAENRRGKGRRRVKFQPEDRRPAQSPENTSVPLVPPNPKEFDIATRIGIRRAVFGT